MICNVQDVQDMYMNVSICNITMWHLCVKSYVLWCPCVGATTLSLCVRPEGDACITLGYNKGLVLCILLISLQQCSSHNIILNSGGKVNYWAVPYRHRICLCEQKDKESYHIFMPKPPSCSRISYKCSLLQLQTSGLLCLQKPQCDVYYHLKFSSVISDQC